MLVEDAVVGEEVLAVDGLDAAVRAHGARVREIAVEPRCPDERDDAVRRRRDLLDRRVRCAHEAGPEQQVLRRIARHRELGEDDEVGPGLAGAIDVAKDLLAVAVDVADDHIQLCESDSQGFRLTVTNLV